MAKLAERIVGTRAHLTREGSMLVSRTRRAGEVLVRALEQEANDWRTYLETRSSALEDELRALSQPRGLERATLRLADETLARAHGVVRARLGRLERELARPARRKARPSAKARPPRAPSRRLVTAPDAA